MLRNAVPYRLAPFPRKSASPPAPVTGIRPILAAFFLALFAMAHVGSASAQHWDSYCKESGESSVGATCHPAEPTEWIFYGGSSNYLSYSGKMDSFEEVIAYIESDIDARFSYCSVRVWPDSDWIPGLNSAVTEQYGVSLYIEVGIPQPDGGCSPVGGTFRNSANKYRLYSCLPGEAGPYLGPDGQRFCVWMPGRCETPNPVSIATASRSSRTSPTPRCSNASS